MKPGLNDQNPKNPKYHFEGTKQSESGKTIYMVLDLKTGKTLEWSEETFNKNKSKVEY
jgi:hypothetical protein